MARPKRFELLTPWFVAKYSIQLSYGRVYEGANYTAISFERKPKHAAILTALQTL
jgi:hypothetical protein